MLEFKIAYEELKKDLRQVMSVLKDREQTVLKMRFGLENFTKTTLEDIGKNSAIPCIIANTITPRFILFFS